MRRKYLFILFALLCLSAASAFAAGGNELGNGGDSFAQEFVALGRGLIQKLRENPDSRIPDIDALEKAVDTTAVVTEARLELKGAEVDAINYPDWNRIELNRRRWAEYDLKKKTSLVLHEYLGIARADDSHYQISGSYSDLAIQPAPPRLELQVHWGKQRAISKGWYRPEAIGGEIGYKLNPKWTVGFSLDSYRSSGEWSTDTTNIYTLFGKYNFSRWGKFQPFGKFGIAYTNSDYLFAVKSVPVLGTAYYPLKGRREFGWMVGLGGTYWFHPHFGLDLGVNVNHFRFDETPFGNAYNFYYSTQIGLRARF